MSARITETQRYIRGDRLMAGAVGFCALVVIVLAGTVSALATVGFLPGVNRVLQVLAGLAFAVTVTGLLVPFYPGKRAMTIVRVAVAVASGFVFVAIGLAWLYQRIGGL